MPAGPAPIPPADLAVRVGPGASADPIEAYEQEGAAVRARIDAALPDDWNWAGRRVLDFGCGSARVLRHYLPEAEQAEFWGCDIDGASIAWIERHLSPPLRVFRNEPVPPLPLERGTFDLVYGTSVFTHIADGWASWLLEMHRILRPGGLFVCSYLGEGAYDVYAGEPYDEDAVGMVVRGKWTAEHCWVLHSEWWLREHWGRAFEVLEVTRPPRDDCGRPAVTQSYLTLRRRDGTFTAADLERVDPGEPREVAGLQTALRLTQDELESVARWRTAPPSARQAMRTLVERSPARALLRARERRRAG